MTRDTCEVISPFAGSDPFFPLLSIVVCNWNYGRYIERCVRSILAQSYGAVECIIVDDASTDGSRAIIERMIAADLSVTCIFNTANLGQTRSCMVGVAKARGDFIALVDADDELLPDYAAIHIRAHLQARDPVGFTSCDMISRLDGRTVLATCMSESLVSQHTKPIILEALRPLCHPFVKCFADLPDVRLRIVYDNTIVWVWPPTSGSVYRRTAIALLFDNNDLGKLKFATDAYLNYAINALCGSILIDGAFAIYNIHGANNFTTTPLLTNLKNYHEERDYGCFAAYCALEHIIRNLPVFAQRLHTRSHLIRVLRTLSRKSRQSNLLRRLDDLFVRYLHYIWTRRLPSLLPYRR